MASAAASLGTELDHILQHHLNASKVSIQVLRLNDGGVIYEKDPDRLLNPASTAKLVTMAAALRFLGPDFTFKTEFYSEQRMREGHIGNLWIKGYGDPLFVTEELESLVQRFKAEGLQQIDGEVYVDDTYFDRDQLITYLSDQQEKVYSIVTGPLSFNFNTIEIHARPGRRGEAPIIELEPPTRYLTLVNQAKTGGARGLSLEAEVTQTGQNEVKIVGSIPRTIREYSWRRGVLDPATYTGTVILEALQGAGISVQGGVHRQAVPPTASLILVHSSPPLTKIIEGLGKHSNNFIAEQLLKTLGAVQSGPPGSEEKGRQVLAAYLSSLGVLSGAYLENGSGLSKLSRLSAAQLVRVLRDLYDAPWRDAVISSLSVAGFDGTIKNRFKGRLTGRLFGKTGTLNQVSGLAGYLISEGEPVVFAMLFNDVSISPRRLDGLEQKILEEVMDEIGSLGRSR